MKSLGLFNLCNARPWKTVGRDTQYKVVVDESTVILAFAPSSSKQDWKDNFNFPVRPYRNMPVGWLAHGGIVRAWKAARDQIVADVASQLEGKRLWITGYSHGGALAVLAHEWFEYNALAPSSVIFGAPRVLWLPPGRVRDRFATVTVVRNRGDVVTHLPPWLFGYRHVGLISNIGSRWYPSIRAHFPEDYLNKL